MELCILYCCGGEEETNQGEQFVSMERSQQTILAFESGDPAASKRVHEAAAPEWEEDGHNW